MLRSFRLANHRSIADEQELLLMPARHSGSSVVPVAAIYGANASGKSNVVDGLGFMRSAVLQSFARWEVEGGIPRQPFRLNAKGRLQPSVYVVELVVENVPYVYGFGVDDNEVVEEWLYSYPEKRKRTLFNRERGEIRFGTTLGELKPKLEMLEELTRPNSLFLSAAARLNLDPLIPVYRWFRTNLRIRRSPRISDFGLVEKIQRFLSRKPDNLARLVSLLTAADIGITNVRIEESDDVRWLDRATMIQSKILELTERLAAAGQDQRQPLEYELSGLHTELHYLERRGSQRRAELRFVHGVEDELFELSEESAGTRSWLELLPTVLDALDLGEVVVIDEIDASLHPLLTAQLIGLFQNRRTNDNGAQLIFTTHDTSLLGTMIGNSVLDRDQIWFVQKNDSSATEVYPLTDFKPRKDQNVERRYLGGSYGGVPVFDEEDFVNAVRDQ